MEDWSFDCLSLISLKHWGSWSEWISWRAMNSLYSSLRILSLIGSQREDQSSNIQLILQQWWGLLSSMISMSDRDSMCLIVFHWFHHQLAERIRARKRATAFSIEEKQSSYQSSMRSLSTTSRTTPLQRRSVLCSMYQCSWCIRQCIMLSSSSRITQTLQMVTLYLMYNAFKHSFIVKLITLCIVKINH